MKRILDKIKKEWRRLKNRVRGWFGKDPKVYGHKEPTGPMLPVQPIQPEPTPVEPPKQPDPVPTPPPAPEPPKDPYGGKPPGEYVGSGPWHDKKKHPYNNWEPLKTEKADRVDSFLWKPTSDNTGLPVVVVSCDKVRRGDLYIEMYDPAWTPIPTGKKQPHKGDSRGNRIHKYARINFYTKRTVKDFQKHGSINVKFYQMINGQKHYLLIGGTGLDYYTVINPAVRMDYRYR